MTARSAHLLVRSTWAIPIVLALASAVGLVAALTGDGWRDTLSWIGLGLPLLATGWAMRRGRNTTTKRDQRDRTAVSHRRARRRAARHHRARPRAGA